MDKLLKRIYEEIIYYEEDAVESDRRINKEVDRLCAAYDGKLTAEDAERLKSLICRVSLTAQEEGFLLGMKYMWGLFKLLETDLKNLKNP